MVVASLAFNVETDKRDEFVSAVADLLDELRSLRGCLGCRLVTDCENPDLFVLVSEWDHPEFLDRHLASTQFQVLQGTHILLRDRPMLSVDEVVSRRRVAKPRRDVLRSGAM